ncbi:MAG: diguanylate cyclase [Pseudomonadota bacterium]
MDPTSSSSEQFSVQAQLNLFQGLVSKLPTIFYRCSLDGLSVDYISPNIEAVLGYPANSINNLDSWWRDKVHSDDLPHALKAFNDWVESSSEEPLRRQYRLSNSQDRYVWIEDIMAEHSLAAEKGLEISGTLRAIDDWVSAYRSLETLSHLVPAMLYQYEKEAHGKVSFPYVNGRVKELFNVSEEQAKKDASMVLDAIADEDIEGFHRTIEQSEKSLSPWEYEFRAGSGDKMRWLTGMSVPERINETTTRWHGVIIDITQQKLLEQELKRRSSTDAMTGIYNRGHFIDAVEKEISRSERNGTTLALLMVDIDFFKKVNDTYGHPEGDKVIKKLAELMMLNLRDSDYCGRIGGEEFAVLLPETDVESAQQIAERLRQTVSKTRFNLESLTFSVTITIGVATLLGGDSWASLFKRADQALYKGKEQGRDQVSVASASPTSE